MKIEQVKEFNPITITLETREEAYAMWEIVDSFDNLNEIDAYDLSIKISDVFCSELKI